MRTKKPDTRFTPEWWAEHTTRDPKTGCHLWTGFVCKFGYGRTARSATGNVLVHRIAYEQANGPIPTKGLTVCHTCDTPSCVNPDHLFLGTQRDNLHDMYKKGRGRPWGHEQSASIVLRPAPPTVLASTVARKKAHKSVGDINLVHQIRTSAMTPQWCRVLGQPGASDAGEIPPDKRPKWWTVELPQKAEPVSDSPDSGADLSSVSSSLRRSESGQ